MTDDVSAKINIVIALQVAIILMLLWTLIPGTSGITFLIAPFALVYLLLVVAAALALLDPREKLY